MLTFHKSRLLEEHQARTDLVHLAKTLASIRAPSRNPIDSPYANQDSYKSVNQEAIKIFLQN